MAPSASTCLVGALVAAFAWWPLLLLPALDLEPPPPRPACPSCMLDHAASPPVQHHPPQGNRHNPTGPGAAAAAAAFASVPHTGGVSSSEVSDTYLRLEAIKQQILSKLGLSSKPNVSSPVPHEVLLETMRIVDYTNRFADYKGVHHKRTPDLEDDFYGRTSEIISFAERGPTFNDQSLLEFAHGQEHEGELRIKSALLWVKVGPNPNLQQPKFHASPSHSILHRNIKMMVFRALLERSVNTTHLSGKDVKLDWASTILIETFGWKKFDVTSEVQKWYALGSARGKLHLLVDCSGCGEVVKPLLNLEPLHPLRHHQQSHQHHRPFLVLHTESVAAKRQRRHVDCGGTIKQCCKQRLYVNFTQLGWKDWIIAPNGYYANYCRGNCGYRTPDTFHYYYTHVMDRYLKMNPLAGMQPCCSPVRFSSISLIYFDQDQNIVKQDLPKMSVDECGCP